MGLKPPLPFTPKGATRGGGAKGAEASLLPGQVKVEKKDKKF